MASPFHYFRKHQKVFIALAAVTAMFVFVVADPLTSWLRTSSDNVRGADSAVASWDGGSLNQLQLESLVGRRYFLSGFLRELVTTGARRVMEDGGTPIDPKVPDFILQDNTPPREVQFEVITTRIMAKLAQQSGMTVSKEMINHYLEEMGLRRVDSADILNLLGRMQGGKAALNERLLFDALEEQLLRHQFFSTFDSAVHTILPHERWQDWSRLNERIALQAAVLPTEQFIAEVPEPDDTQVAAFYEAHKEREPGAQYRVMGAALPAPDPGFKEPRRVRLHYLLGDINTWRDKHLDSIPDEEIADYYERNKRAQFVKTSFSDTQDATEEGSATDAQPEKDAVESDPDESGEEPAEETTELPIEPAADDTGAVAKPSPFRLTALADEPKEEAAEEEGAAEEEDAAEEKPAVAAEAGEDASEGEDSAEESGEGEEPVKFYPLEEVEDEIRRQLATNKAVQELEPIMRRSYTELRTVFNKFGGKVIEAQSKKLDPPEPPAKLAQLEQMAEKVGLRFDKTGLLSQRELVESAIGRSRDSQTDRIPVAASAFSKSTMNYEPSLSKDLDGNWYLALRVEDIPARVPKLEEIRNDVVAAWKKNEAAQLALEKAETLAKEAAESDQSFEDFFASQGLELVTTDLFSWLTFGTTAMEMRGGAKLGDAPPLESVGPEFMSKAFELKAEQVEGVLNFDETQAYVLRLHNREQTEEELQKLFLSEINGWYRGPFGGYMRQVRSQNSQSKLLKQLTERVGLEFDPDWEKSVGRR